MRTLLATILGASLLVGCAGAHAVGPAGDDGLPPPLLAGATVPLWDHYCAYPNGVLDRILGAASAQGWELVSVTALPYAQVLVCFKRPHVEAGGATP
jgi:hypothetical protein